MLNSFLFYVVKFKLDKKLTINLVPVTVQMILLGFHTQKNVNLFFKHSKTEV